MLGKHNIPSKLESGLAERETRWVNLLEYTDFPIVDFY